MGTAATEAIHGAAREESKTEKVIQVLRESKVKSTTSLVNGKSTCNPAENIFGSSTQLPHVTHTNLASFILENATGKFAAHTAIIDGASGARYSYSQVSEKVKRTIVGLIAAGVKPRDVVLMLSPNSPDFAIVYLAIVSLGAVAAPSNPLNTEADIKKQILQANVKFVVTVRELLSKVQSCTLPILLIGDEDVVSSDFGPTIRHLSELCSDDHDDVTATASSLSPSHPDDTCTLLFSSGTTGLSKAVQLSHRNFMTAVTAYNTLEPGASTSERDVCLAIIPMFHVYGLGIVLLATMERGASVVSLGRYSLPAMLQCVERFQVTVATLVPPIYVMLVKSAETTVAKYDLSSLRILATGAAPMRAETMTAVQRMFPHCVIRQGYGMTESPLISFTVVENERRQWGSVGKLVPGTEARVVQVLTGDALPALATGEVWIRGPQVMKGYLNDPEQTRSTIDAEGWLHTGDMGYVDTHGYLYIVDRLKDVIKYKAYQVAPGELEAVLLKHPRILDAAVVPFPDEEAGELPMAFVVRREEQDLTEQEIISFVGKMVAPYKKVRKVEFINAIPKSNTGKILRKELVVRIRQQVEDSLEKE